jgi:lysophospholipid acyltransferase (LPLAT)-like uncharacterized protein
VIGQSLKREPRKISEGVRPGTPRWTNWAEGMVNWIKMRVLPPVGAWLIRALGWSLGVRTAGGKIVDELYRQDKRVIIAFWHGRQLMMPLAYRGAEAHILISQHRDGELIHQIVSRFGFRSVRGSTTRGGAAALRQLIRLGRSGVDLVVTPDGPKGPRQVVQMGAIQLAKATSLPIVPLTFGCSKKNFSRAGIVSWSHTHSARDCSSGDSQYGFRRMQRMRCLRPNDASWKRS